MATCLQTVDIEPLVTVDAREALTCEVRRGSIARPRSLFTPGIVISSQTRAFEAFSKRSIVISKGHGKTAAVGALSRLRAFGSACNDATIAIKSCQSLGNSYQ